MEVAHLHTAERTLDAPVEAGDANIVDGPRRAFGGRLARKRAVDSEVEPRTFGKVGNGAGQLVGISGLED